MNASELLTLSSAEDNVNEEGIIDKYFTFYIDIMKEINGLVSLKGNVLLNKLFPDVARSTVDLDMSIVNKTLYDEIKPLLKLKGEMLTKCGGRFEIKEDISDKTSGGMSVYDISNNNIFSIDISVENKLDSLITKYVSNNITFNGNSISKIVADKCLSTLSFKRFRRVKDFYDLYILVAKEEEFALKLNYAEIKSIMIDKVGLEEFNALISHYPFTELIIKELNKAWGKLVVTSVLYGDVVLKPEFIEVYSKVSKVYTSIRNCRL